MFILYVDNLVWKISKDMSGITKLEGSVSCIGTPVCQIGILNSQETLIEIIELFRKKGMARDVLQEMVLEFLYEIAVHVDEDGLEFNKWLDENKVEVE